MMIGAKKRYDGKHKVTRILLADYLVLKRISHAAGVSMAEALHRLIEHQAQLPMLDMAIKPMSAMAARSISAVRIAPVTTIATNGSKAVAFRIKTKGVRYE